MATLNWPTTTANDQLVFTPISSALANLPNGAGTIAVLARPSAADLGEFVGLNDAGLTAWYHSFFTHSSSPFTFEDDDGIASQTAPTLTGHAGSTANDFWIGGVDWPAGGAATERYHKSGPIGSAESWTHESSAANNGGNRAGPGTSGHLNIGYFGEGVVMRGDIALIGIWAGTRFTDTDWTNLWVNKMTSDWCNHPAGKPTCLIECTSRAPTDIGTNPSTFSSITAGVALTGLVPTGWTFDGCGVQGAGDNPPIGLLGRGAGW